MSSFDKWMKNHIGISFAMLVWHEILTWRLVANKLHIFACELHCIYNIIYNIGCSLQLL
jgi:hypothetical protein